MTKVRGWTLGGLVTVMAIVGAVFTSGSATGINVWRIGDHDKKFTEVDKKIEANKIECDRKIEAAEDHCNQKIGAIEAASDARLEAQRVRDVEQMKVLIRVETDLKWLKNKEENGNNPN